MWFELTDLLQSTSSYLPRWLALAVFAPAVAANLAWFMIAVRYSWKFLFAAFFFGIVHTRVAVTVAGYGFCDVKLFGGEGEFSSTVAVPCAGSQTDAETLKALVLNLTCETFLLAFIGFINYEFKVPTALPLERYVWSRPIYSGFHILGSLLLNRVAAPKLAEREVAFEGSSEGGPMSEPGIELTGGDEMAAFRRKDWEVVNIVGAVGHGIDGFRAISQYLYGHPENAQKVHESLLQIIFTGINRREERRALFPDFNWLAQGTATGEKKRWRQFFEGDTGPTRCRSII